MASRLQYLNLWPWNGKLVTSVDESLLAPGDCTLLDNIVFGTQSTKKKREGIDHNWDDLAIVSVSRSSSGTSRTIVVTGYRFAVGDRFYVSGAGNTNYNTSTNVATVSAIATTTSTGDTATYTFTGAASLAEASTADTGMTITLASSIISLIDYWYGDDNIKTQRLMGVTSAGQLIEYASGARTNIADTGTAYTIPSGGLTRGSMTVFDNRLIVAVDGETNTLKHYFPTSLSGSGELEDIENTTNYAATPKASIVTQHQGRILCNDKERPDRLHYSTTGVYNQWQGSGDSGAIDVGLGDGDPEGITAIISFKGVLFVAKRTKLYRIVGALGYDYSLEKISDGIGVLHQNAVAFVDQDDVLFVSERGVHSLGATDQFGGFSSQYVSADIQKSFNEDWERSLRTRIQACYVPTLNSVAFAVAEADDTSKNHLWIYNVKLGSWYRWPNISCQSIAFSQDADKARFYLGTSYGRVSQALDGDLYDTTVADARQPVSMRIRTGLIFPSGNPSYTSAFKKFTLIYKPVGTHTIVAKVKIDNFSEQSMAFSGTGAEDLLGTTFIMGQSVLGFNAVAGASTQSIDGYGRGCRITLEQSGTNEEGEILGLQVLFEPAFDQQEVRSGDDT
jgi:hypothetical protein